MNVAHAITQRIREGKHTVVVGTPPALDDDLAVVRVRCDGPTSTHAALERATLRIDAMLGTPSDATSERERLAAYRRVLAGTPFQPADVRFVDACNRLEARAPGRAALVLEGFDAADEETTAALLRILREPGWLELPIVVAMEAEPRRELMPLLDAIGARGGSVRAPEAPPGDGRPSERATLPMETLRVLRAASVVGSTFEPRLVALLLREDVDAVLEELQRASDLGVPIADTGDGHLSMPSDLARSLAGSVLPSLRARWHELLAGALAPETAAAPAAPAPRDALRAAAHFAAAGAKVEAVANALDAVREMTSAGETSRAVAQLESAAREAATLSDAPSRALLGARIALERARLRWVGAVVPSSLRIALDDVETARRLLPETASASLHADVAATAAAILSDLGDPESSAAALRALTEGAEHALARGAPLEAARLLVDEALARLRAGDVHRTTRLVEHARALFEARLREAPDDARARASIADADHVLARVPLHVASAGGGLGQALRAARSRAEAAAAAYDSLGRHRDLARVWETMARLETRLGDRPAAERHLRDAIEAEESAGDLTGLARSTAALAELLARSGKPADAVPMLEASIAINLDRRSSVGLRADARALSLIRGAASTKPELSSKLASVSDRLADAMHDVAGELHQLVAMRPAEERRPPTTA